jgi:predicted nuclease of predicted toxin-antitoxin system
MPRKFHKHKLLLDEGFHYRHKLPITNSRFDVKHIAGDFKKVSLPDLQVYELAQKEKRLLVTYNVKDFVEFAEQSRDTGILGVSPNITTEQIDKKLTALLTRSGENELTGKLTMITGES